MPNHTQTPSKGRIVFVRPTEKTPEGDDELPAIINRVHSDDCVSVTVFPFGGNSYAMTSLMHADIGSEANIGVMVWRWPPRV